MSDTKSENHKSYGMIGISHTSSTGTNLVGSEFKHHSFIELTISRSEKRRDLSRNWWYGREELISISLSEAQYVELMSRPNMGPGVPCTLNHVMGERMPGAPAPEPAKKQGHADLLKTAATAQNAMKEALVVIEGGIAAGKIGKKQMESMAHSLRCQIANFAPNMEYVVNSFDEAMDETIKRAGIEIEATVANIALRLGVDELKRIGGGWSQVDLGDDCADSAPETTVLLGEKA